MDHSQLDRWWTNLPAWARESLMDDPVQSVYVREADRRDAAGILGLLSEDRDRLASSLEFSLIEGRLPSEYFHLVAFESGGKMIGYLEARIGHLGNPDIVPPEFADTAVAYVSLVFVGAKNRGQGAGSMLMEALMSEARSAGCRYIYTTPLEDDRDEDRRRWFRRVGFVDELAQRNLGRQLVDDDNTRLRARQ